ncbi:MAG: HlyD family efflux transporter periplasmic adaptor subunit [Colwellia sp.]|nr:HlyD family efflux transporter periplasmic adaptor subunit [Colwellia sp.]
MDSSIDKATLNAQKRRKLAKLIGWATFALALFYGIQYVLSPAIERDSILIAHVEQGPVSSSIIASGVVVPRFEQQISSPMQTEITRVFLKAGAQVKAGDIIMELNNSRILLLVNGLHDQIQLKDVAIDRLKQQQAKDVRALQSRIELLNVDLKGQNIHLNRYLELQTKHIVSDFDVDTAKLTVEKTQIELRQLKEQVNDIRGLINIDLEKIALEKKILSHQLATQQVLLAQCQVKAPYDGILTQVLDQPGQNVNQGLTLAKVANLKSYRIEGTLSDYYAQQLSNGLEVKIKLPSGDSIGTLTRVLPTVTNGVMQILVDFNQPDISQLRPNLRLELEIITAQKQQSLRVKNGIAFNGGGLQEIFVVNQDSARKQKVTTGMSNAQYIEIITGLEQGDQVIISDISEYQHLNTIQIN